jgi:hypothetical protein
MIETTPPIDLLPLARRIARARQRAARRWLAAGVLIAAASFGPAGAMALGAGASEAETGHRLDRAARSLEALSRSEPLLRQQLAELRRTERIVSIVGDRPDWRPVLQAVASVAEGARFERIACRLIKNPVPEVSVVIMAMVESQTEARRLVLRIEGLGIFDTVVLNNESRVALPAGEFVRCEIAGRFKLKDGV